MPALCRWVVDNDVLEHEGLFPEVMQPPILLEITNGQSCLSDMGFVGLTPGDHGSGEVLQESPRHTWEDMAHVNKV